jgi:hypothetical protein
LTGPVPRRTRPWRPASQASPPDGPASLFHLARYYEAGRDGTSTGRARGAAASGGVRPALGPYNSSSDGLALALVRGCGAPLV